MKKENSRDDIEDIIQISRELENHIQKILTGNDEQICMSSLANAISNIIIENSQTIEEIIKYRNFLLEVFDKKIMIIQIKEDSFSSE